MQLVSLRVITGDVARLVEFYEQATGLRAQWRAEQFAEFVDSSCTLAIGTADTNPTAIIEFLVEDVDREYERLTNSGLAPEIVQKPTTMPWGNRSLLFRDPDGNLINFFTRGDRR